MSLVFTTAIPVLRSFSADKLREFYVGYLGFTLDWEYRFGDNFPLYAQLSRAGLKLHLSEHHGDATPGSTVFVPCEGVAGLHAELAAKDYAHAKPGLEALEWGLQLEVTDPFGNRLRFCQLSADDEAEATSDAAFSGAPAPGLYRHTDGGYYRVTGMARDSRDTEPVVLYDHVWPFEARTWTRPLHEWASRFTPVPAAELAQVQQGDRAALQARIRAARAARKGQAPA